MTIKWTFSEPQTCIFHGFLGILAQYFGLGNSAGHVVVGAVGEFKIFLKNGLLVLSDLLAKPRLPYIEKGQIVPKLGRANNFHHMDFVCSMPYGNITILSYFDLKS